MVHGEVVGLKNGELVMSGILKGDCGDRMLHYLCSLPFKCVSASVFSFSNRYSVVSK